MTVLMVLLTITILFLVFGKFLDPLLVSLVKENDLDMLTEDSENFILKRIKKAKLVLLLIVLWPISNYSLFYLFFIAAAFIVILKSEYWNLKRKQRQTAALLKFQFPIWLRQLQILLQTNTVAVSLELSLSHAPLLIRKELRRLIVQIKEDPLNIAFYLSFLKGYRLSEIERAMKLLYRYNTVGKEDAYLQFNRMIQTTTKWLRSERNAHHDDSLAMYEWISMVPLVGVTVFFLAIMCDVVLSMFTNGL